jgi:hypothetical protein
VSRERRKKKKYREKKADTDEAIRGTGGDAVAIGRPGATEKILLKVVLPCVRDRNEESEERTENDRERKEAEERRTRAPWKVLRFRSPRAKGLTSHILRPSQRREVADSKIQVKQRRRRT